MKRVIIALFVLLLSLSSFGQTAKRKPSPKTQEPTAAQKQQFVDDQEAINTLHDKDIEANIALDPAAIENLWTDDFVSIHPGGPPIIGKEANSKKLADAVDQLKSQEILGYNEEFQEVRVIADEAYEWGLITVRIRPMAGGPERSFKMNMLRILKREPDGTWRISRAMYNDATPQAAPAKPQEAPKQDDKNKLKD